MASESGWQGTGMRSSGLKTEVCARMRRRTSESVRRCSAELVVAEAAGLLNGLEGDAADAGLLQGEVDDAAEFVVVDAAFYGDDEGGGDVELVEALESLFADAAQVGAAQLHQGFAA